jgi:hypothetical protein
MIPDYGLASLQYKDIIKDITPIGEWTIRHAQKLIPTNFAKITKDKHRRHQLDYLE